MSIDCVVAEPVGDAEDADCVVGETALLWAEPDVVAGICGGDVVPELPLAPEELLDGLAAGVVFIGWRTPCR